MVISYGDPKSRQFHLEREFLSWDIKQYQMYYNEEENNDEEENKDTTSDKEPKVHYAYVCTKRKDADKVCKLNYKLALRQLEIEEEQERRLIELEEQK